MLAVAPLPNQIQPAQSIVKTSHSHNEAIDFIRGEDGHAGLSQRKTAELLKVAQPTISELLKSDKLLDRESAESITGQGFRGDKLVKLAGRKVLLFHQKKRLKHLSSKGFGVLR